MPFYEYSCKECTKVFKVLQKLKDPPPDKCPECGSGDVNKILSAGHFNLKGNGFYKRGMS